MSVVCSGMFVVSITLEIVNNLVLIKRLADQGYRYENDKISNYYNFSYLWVNFIPFINILTFVKRFVKVNSNSPILMAQNIIAMTTEEKNIYDSNPSIATVIELCKNNKIMPDMILIYTKGEKENIIYFTKDDDKYIITSSKGPVSILSKDKQYELLTSNLDEIDRITSKKLVMDESLEKNISYSKQKSNLSYDYTLGKEKVFVKKYDNHH